jgi:hypothetical protein
MTGLFAAVGDSLPVLARYALVIALPVLGFAGCLLALVHQGHEADRDRQARLEGEGSDWQWPPKQKGAA